MSGSKEIRWYPIRRLKSQKDLNGKRPSVYMIESIRTTGKTTAVLKTFYDEYVRNKRMFALLYRNTYELKAADKIFSEVLDRELGVSYETKTVATVKDTIHTILLNDVPFGYALCLKKEDEIKKYSPMFSNVWNLLFDEFQLLSGKYLPDEPKTMYTILSSIARGGGEIIRPIRLYMCANQVSLFNPWYLYYDIYNRLNPKAEFIRGNGWILHLYNAPHIAAEIQNASITQAFADVSKSSYDRGTWTYDYSNFILKHVPGNGRYLCSIINHDEYYSVWEYVQHDILYVRRKFDPEFPILFALTDADHSEKTIRFKHYNAMFKYFTTSYDNGRVRFDSYQSANVFYRLCAIQIFNQL